MSVTLITARRIVQVLLPFLILSGLMLAAPDLPRWDAEAVAAAVVIGGVWAWWLLGRRVRLYDYAERSDDLLVTAGILFRQPTIVPYGRMPLVDVTAGPIDRSLGLTTVRLRTVAAATDAAVPGLPPGEEALRDRLAARGEQHSAGV